MNGIIYISLLVTLCVDLQVCTKTLLLSERLPVT